MAAQTSGSHEIKLPENISTMTVEVLEDLLSRLRHIEAQIEDELRKKGKDGDCSLQQKATAGADDITALQQKVTVGADDIASLQKKVTAGADDIAKQGHISKQGLESIRIAVQLVNEDLPRRRRFSYYSAQRCKSFLLKILSSCGPDAFMLCAIFVGKDRIGKMRKSDKDELLAFFARNHTSLASSNLRKLRFHLPLDLGGRETSVHQDAEQEMRAIDIYGVEFGVLLDFLEDFRYAKGRMCMPWWANESQPPRFVLEDETGRSGEESFAVEMSLRLCEKFLRNGPQFGAHQQR